MEEAVNISSEDCTTARTLLERFICKLKFKSPAKHNAQLLHEPFDASPTAEFFDVAVDLTVFKVFPKFTQNILRF